MLKQTFTTTKGNKIEIIAGKSTGGRLDQIEYTIRFNGELKKETYNYTQLIGLMPKHI